MTAAAAARGEAVTVTERLEAFERWAAEAGISWNTDLIELRAGSGDGLSVHAIKVRMRGAHTPCSAVAALPARASRWESTLEHRFAAGQE